MIKSLLHIVVLALWLTLVISCKNEPRRTSGSHHNVEDKQTEYLIELNKQMIDGQLSMMKSYVDSVGLDVYLDSMGFWAQAEGKSFENNIKSGDKLTLSLVISDLASEYRDSSIVAFSAGKSSTVPLGVQQYLFNRNHKQFTLLLPYSLAYGVKGIPGKVAPYSPIRADVEVLKLEKR